MSALVTSTGAATLWQAARWVQLTSVSLNICKRSLSTMTQSGAVSTPACKSGHLWDRHSSTGAHNHGISSFVCNTCWTPGMQAPTTQCHWPSLATRHGPAAQLTDDCSPADVGQAGQCMPQHLHVRLAAVAAAHEGQQRTDTTAVHHKLAACLAVARAELDCCHCGDDLHTQHHARHTTCLSKTGLSDHCDAQGWCSKVRL